MKKLFAIVVSCAAINAANANFSQDVLSAVQAVQNDQSVTQDIKGEVAFALAMKVSLDDAIICITRTPNGQLYRLHSVSRNNGLVTDPGEIQNFNDMFMAAQNGPATVQKTIVSGGKQEMFNFDVVMVDQNHLVASRHH